MRVFDGMADVDEQLDASLARQVFAKAGERFPIDELKGKVGPPIGGCAAVEQVGDVGVLQRGEDSPFLAKAEDKEAAAKAGAQQLQRRSLAEAFALALGKVNGTHAAFGYQSFQLPWASMAECFRRLIELDGGFAH